MRLGAPAVIGATHSGTPTFAWAAAAAAIAGVLWIHRDTFASIVAIWSTSATFNHGFLVPILAAALLIYNTRRSAPFAPELAVAALPVLAMLSGLWVVGRISGVLAIEQLAAVAMLPTALWAILGSAFAKQNLFPLAFLLFAVPLGEDLVPPLMDFTAWFVVHALQLTGIPVYREGLFFSIPSGDFEVARACSGIRYQLAMLCVGSVFAYLTFSGWKRRVSFMAACIVVPLVANGLRAYGIVLLAHFSNMRIAVGVDHFIYGWVFFGVIVGLLFLAGARFSDRPAGVEAERTPVAARGGAVRISVGLAVALLAAALGPAVIASRAVHEEREVSLGAFAVAPGWIAEPAAADWSPVFAAPKAQRQLRYRRAADGVDLYVAVYDDPGDPRGELVHASNEVYRPPWVMVERRARSVVIAEARALSVVATTLRLGGSDRYRLVWHWYEVDGARTHREWQVKALEAWRALRGREGSAAVIAVSTVYDADAVSVERPLLAFVASHADAMSRLVAAGNEPR
jgi:exosortase A